MKPYLTTTVCFFLIIGIGHVNALPLTTYNQLVPREDFSILKKSLYTRADEGDSGTTEGPARGPALTDDEPQHKKTKLDHSEGEVVSSALGAPKNRKALPTVGQPRGTNARPTLDDIRTKADSERLAFQYRDTMTDVEAKNLLKEMIDGQLDEPLAMEASRPLE
ncbi:hypothetical protein H0H93_012372 [Arthromyces matolae]|nr:hypothetical protein H0H93_012372 [Arthromyces matolae]